VYDKFGKGTNCGLSCEAPYGLLWLPVIPYFGVLQAKFPECKYMRISSVIRMGFFCFSDRNEVAELSRRNDELQGNEVKETNLYCKNFGSALRRNFLEVDLLDKQG
jgi:hypothetical protein